MRRASLVLTATAAVALPATGCIASNSGAAVFPARYDVSPVLMSRSQSHDAGLHVAGALSWASASPNPRTPLDVSMGYQVESYHAGSPEGASPATTMLESSPTGSSATDDPTLLHGPFLELGFRLAGTEHHRAWLSARGSLLFQRVGGHTRAGMGGVLRLADELFASGAGRGYIGAVGLGPFIEVGLRSLPAGTTALVATAGLSLRVPLVAVR